MSTTERHTYSNPTIQEVALEISFRAEEGSWSPLSFGKFFQRVFVEFPSIENVQVPMFRIERGSPPVVSEINPSPQVLRYKHATRPLLLQLAENRISIFAVGSYPGWEQFKTDIVYAWENVMAVVEPASIIQIGLRYINRIERSGLDETAGEWLKATSYIPESVLNSESGFLSQVISTPSKTTRISVIVTEVDAAIPDSPFIFDIDASAKMEVPADTASMLQEVDRLHDEAWHIFSSAKTEKLERLLKGELS